MSKTDEILELKCNIPNLILKILGYKIKSKNKKCITFQKNKYGKDIFNYSIVYSILIFKDKEIKSSRIFINPYYFKSGMYEWFKGEDALNYLMQLDEKLAKFTKIKEVIV